MSTSLKVLMVSDVSPLSMEGGGERVLWEQASRLVKRGHRVSIVSRCPAKAVAETVEREGVYIRHYPVNRRSPPRFLLSSIEEARRAVASALAEERPEVLQLYQPFSGYGCLRSARVRGIPILYSFLSPAPLEYISRQGMTVRHRPGLIGRAAQIMLWAIERTCLLNATQIHVLSDFSAGQLWKLYRIPSDRIVKIPGGADTQRFHPAANRRALRQALGLSEDSPVLLTVRNLEARMGLDRLIQAMAILRQRIPEAILLIGGAGSLRKSLESLTASLNLQAQVRFLGYIPEPDLPRHYQAADVFVLPTRELEGFGLITVESLACGTPVVGTAVGATPEILRSLDPSLLFRNTTPEAMAEDLADFFTRYRGDPEASRSLRENCRRHAELHYSWDASVASLEKALRTLAQRPGSASVARPCPGCGNPARDQDVVYLGSPYLRCASCQTAMAAELPSATALRRHYEDEYPLRFSHEHAPEARLELFDSLLERLRVLGRKGRLLDVGCGGGHLLASAARRGWRGLGTDLSLQACVIARRTAGHVVQAEGAALPLRDASVDAVSLINVVDHTADPLATLHEARRVLIPGGLLAIRIPNASFHRPCIRVLTSLGPLVRWYGWDGYPILHLYGFTAVGLRSLVARAGFDVVEVRNSSVAAQEFRSPQRGLWGVGRHFLQRCLGAGVSGIQLLSRGRWLVGPSIELYARASSGSGEAKA